MPAPPPFWDGVLRRLGADLPAFALDAWVRPLRVEPGAAGLRLVCPTPFHRERVRERFAALIAQRVEDETGSRLPIEVELASGAPAELATTAAPAEPAPAPRAAGARPEARSLSRASLPYTFETFVVGPCNALAREAALALAQGRQRELNPLYLASAPGMGKTHLARAIVDAARRSGAERAIYESSEAFTNRFMASIRGRTMDGFKRRYRESCDLLVIEDVQFLAAKSATQLELFHTLTHLVDAGARVVLTGDRMPRDVAGLDPRLRSQLTAGLVAEIEPPDAAVRRQVLRARASAGGVGLPEPCLDLLVESVRGSVRDLEGALIQLVSMAPLLKRPIDLDLARAALHKLAPAPGPARWLEPGDVVACVAAFFGVTREALAARSRRRDALLPRQLAMYLCRRYTQAPLAEIAAQFGRDHPAVANAVKVVERRMLERAPLRYQVEELAARLDRLRDQR
jgi:chromosomal replication initiator protein